MEHLQWVLLANRWCLLPVLSHLGFAYKLMLRPVSPEFFMFPDIDFRISPVFLFSLDKQYGCWTFQQVCSAMNQLPVISWIYFDPLVVNNNVNFKCFDVDIFEKIWICIFLPIRAKQTDNFCGLIFVLLYLQLEIKLPILRQHFSEELYRHFKSD